MAETSTPQPQKSSKNFASLLHSAPQPKHRTLKQEIDEELSDAEFDAVLEEVRQNAKNCHDAKFAEDSYCDVESDEEENASISSSDVTSGSETTDSRCSDSDDDESKRLENTDVMESSVTDGKSISNEEEDVNSNVQMQGQKDKDAQ